MDNPRGKECQYVEKRKKQCSEDLLNVIILIKKKKITGRWKCTMWRITCHHNMHIYKHMDIPSMLPTNVH